MKKRSRARGEGSVFRRRRSDGSPYPGWYVKFRDPATGRLRREKAGPTKAHAEAVLAERLRRDRPLVPSLATVRDLVDRYLALVELPPTTRAGRAPRLHIAAAFFGQLPAGSIGEAEAEGFLRQIARDRGITLQTVRRYKSNLSVVWRMARRQGVVTRNPWRSDLGLSGRVQRFEPDYLGLEDLHRLYAAAPPDFQPFLVLLGETGLRRSEAQRLLWMDHSPQTRQIAVRRATKSGDPRHVPLNERAVAALLGAQGGNGRPDPAAPIFPGHTNRWVRSRFEATRLAAGLPRIRLHDLRHAYATRMARAGIPEADRAAVLGHSVEVARRYSAHAPKDAARRAVEELERHESSAARSESSAN